MTTVCSSVFVHSESEEKKEEGIGQTKRVGEGVCLSDSCFVCLL